MRPRYLPFYLCQRVHRLHWQQILTLSQNKKKVVSDSPEVHLNVSKQFFLNFHFFIGFNLIQLKWQNCGKYSRKLLAQMAHTVAICQCMWRMQQQIASIDSANGSNLLAYMAHAVAKLCKIVCFARVDGAYSSKLLAYAAHAVAICQRIHRMRQQFASVDSACGS